MNYTRAVNLALEGDERGFRSLYESTFKSKYYLAYKYMKDSDAANDVLQDSYTKAFSKLGTLANPEAFSGWLGIIVANTAKNALKGTNPELFSEVEQQNEEGDHLDFEVEETNENFLPERSYNRKQIDELVDAMVDSLPDEQRMCVLMYYYEGMAVADIALAMGCSENTVKSRLNYARKKIQAQAEDMQNRGYELFAGLPALLWLLRTQEAGLAADGTIAAAGQVVASRLAAAGAGAAGTAGAGAVGATAEVAPTVTASTTAQQTVTASTTAQQAAGQAAVKAGAGAAKAGFFSRTVVKVVLAVVLGCAAGGTAVYGISQAVPTSTQEEEVVAEPDEDEAEAEVVEEVVEAEPTEEELMAAAIAEAEAAGYTTVKGTVRVMSLEDLAEYLGGDDLSLYNSYMQNKGDNIWYSLYDYALLFFDEPTSIIANQTDIDYGTDIVTGEASCINLGEHDIYNNKGSDGIVRSLETGDISFWESYDGQTIVFGYLQDETWWPSDGWLPLGAPSTGSGIVVYVCS